MAPPIHHRVGILLLEADAVVVGAAPAIVAVLAAGLVGTLWFGLPLIRRGKE